MKGVPTDEHVIVVDDDPTIRRGARAEVVVHREAMNPPKQEQTPVPTSTNLLRWERTNQLVDVDRRYLSTVVWRDIVRALDG